MKKMTITIPGKDPIVCEVDAEEADKFGTFYGEIVSTRKGVTGCTIVVRRKIEIGLDKCPEWAKIGTTVFVDINNFTIRPL